MVTVNRKLKYTDWEQWVKPLPVEPVPHMGYSDPTLWCGLGRQ